MEAEDGETRNVETGAGGRGGGLGPVVVALVLLLTPLLAPRAASPRQGDSTRELPATFEANRIFVHPVTPGGDTLRLYTDTGGGRYLSRAAVDRLGLSVRDTTLRGRRYAVTRFPSLRSDSRVPAPAGKRILVRPEGRMHRLLHPEADGLLGQAWFGGRVRTGASGRRWPP